MGYHASKGCFNGPLFRKPGRNIKASYANYDEEFLTRMKRVMEKKPQLFERENIDLDVECSLFRSGRRSAAS